MTDPTPPVTPQAPSPEPTPPATTASPETPSTTAGTPPASSPAADPIPSAQPEAEPTPEAAAAAARAATHESAEAYAINLDDEGRQALGLQDDDPLVAGLRSYAATSGKPQGWLDDVLEGAAHLAREGLFDAGFDPAAEAAALGENAAGRRREVEVFAQGLKDRGDLDEAEFGELMSLSPTAAGVRLVEKLRRMMGTGQIPAPGGVPDEAQEAARTQAREMRKDPRYETDRQYRAEADAAWRAAWPGSR